MKVPYVISGNMAYRALFTKTEKTKLTFTFVDSKRGNHPIEKKEKPI